MRKIVAGDLLGRKKMFTLGILLMAGLTFVLLSPAVHSQAQLA